MRNKLSDAIKFANRSALVLGSLAAVAMAVPSVSMAQDADGQMEEVLVTGIRGALKNAVDIKRNSTAMVDAVSAEDVGKFPDSDVGQSLGRVPGVTVARSFGQGASVSIRGTDPLMTLTTLNGQNVATTGWYDQLNIDRSFNYSLLPSELIAGMEVYKTTRADLVEGGIGGTVIVKTRKPLDLDAHTVFASVKGEHGSLNDNWAPEVSGLYSYKNDAESFGILVSGSFIDREYVRLGTESDLDWGGRSSVQPSTFIQDQERTAFDLTAQFRPTDALEFGLHVMTLELGADSTGSNMYINTDTDWTDPPFGPGNTVNPSACQQFNAAGVCVLSVTPETRASKVFHQYWLREGKMSSDTYELNGKFEGDNFSVSAIAGKTEAEGGTEMTANFGYGWWGDRFGAIQWAGTVDSTGKKVKIDGRDMSFSVDQLDTTSNTSQWTGTKGPNSDEETYFQVDVDFDLELGAINKFEAGIRSTDHTFTRQEYRAVYGSLPNSFDTASLFSGTMELGSEGWTVPKPNRNAMISATESLVDEFVYSRPAYGKIEEENFSLYGMFSFEGEGYSGNFGLRYIDTEVTSAGHEIDNSPADRLGVNAGWSEGTVSVSDSYRDVLPSLNAKFDLTDDLVLRTSIGQAITRPTYDNLFLVSSSGYPDDRMGNEQLTYGNPGLLPMKSSQADVGFEYYYGDGNMISATYFIKDISNFVVGTTPVTKSVGVINNDLEVPADSWIVSGYENAAGAEIEGIELQLNHAWDNGFGININYTYTDASAPAEVYTDGIGMFTEASKDSANIVGYWENDVFSARAAYNWRSEYMVREYGKYYGNRMHDDFGTLDLSFGWNMLDSVKLSLEVVNLLAEDDVQYGVADAGNEGVKPALRDGFPAWSFEGETTYKVGVSYSF